MLRAEMEAVVKTEIFAACGKMDVDDNFPAAIWTQMTGQNVSLLSKKYVVRHRHKESKRFLLYIRCENQVFLMSEDCMVIQFTNVSFWKGDDPLQNTLLDGRMHVLDNKKVFVIYDIIQGNSIPMHVYNFESRFTYIEQRILRPRFEKLGLNPSAEALVIEREPFWNLYDLDKLVPFDQDKYSGLMFHDKLPYKCQLYPNWLVWEWTSHLGTGGVTFSEIHETCQRASKRKLSGNYKELWEQCFICATEQFEGYAAGCCNHIICMRCSAKERYLKENLNCCYCQLPMPVVLYSHEVQSDANVALKQMSSSNLAENCMFKDHKVELDYNSLFAARCSVEKCLQKDEIFVNFWALRAHVFQVHGLSPCHLCDDDQKADFLSNRRWAKKSSCETYLSHLLEHHKMCYYCEFDHRMHNNWFANQEMLSEHEAGHECEMGEENTRMDYDAHFLGSEQIWRVYGDKYKEYQHAVAIGDTTKQTEFLANEVIAPDPSYRFVNLPVSRVHAISNYGAKQICHLCRKLIDTQTTDMAEIYLNKEYMIHLLSEHIMCFFCAWCKGIPNVWFANMADYGNHVDEHMTEGNSIFDNRMHDLQFVWNLRRKEAEFVAQLKSASTLFIRRYGGWRRVKIVKSTYYSDNERVQKLPVTERPISDLYQVLTCHVQDSNANYASALCHLCVRNNDYRLVDKSTDEKNLSHLNEHHLMCCYCEWDCRNYNNWFANNDELTAHLDIHDTEVGNQGTVYSDPHYKIWQHRAGKPMGRENVFTNLPLSNNTVSGEIIKQTCEFCHETIPRETTWTDRASFNREYLRHLLSKHIMCFFCAYYHSIPNQWFSSKLEYSIHCIGHTTDIRFFHEYYVWKELETQFVNELKMQSTLYRRMLGEWRRVPLVSSEYYQDDPNIIAMDLFAGLPPVSVRNIVGKHPADVNPAQHCVDLVIQGLIKKPLPENVVDKDFVQDPFADV